MHELIRSHGCLNLKANQFLTLDVLEAGVLELNFGHLLVSKVSCSSLSNDEKLIIFHLKDAIVALRQHKTVCLSVHCFRAERTSHKEHVAIAKFLQTFWELEHLDLDASVLLWANAFVFLPRTVVVSHWLAILHAVDGVSFPELDLLSFVEMVELPADEGVIVRIALSRDEGASPVCMQAEPGEHSLAERWEVVEPVVWVLEEGDLFVWDAGLPQDLELGARWGFVVRVLLLVFFEFCWRGLVAGCCIVGDLSPESDSGG